MASISERLRPDGTVSGYRVQHRIDGRLTSDNLPTMAAAVEFAGLVDRLGGEAARAIRDARTGTRTGAPLLADWLSHHIDHLTGVTDGTRSDYRAIARRDIGPTLGQLPVDTITREHIAGWVNRLAASGLSGKTIKNRHAFLSAALRTAVEAGHATTNPCRGMRLPRTDHNRREMTFLSHAEFARLVDAIDEHWRPLVVLLAGTGMRWGEATALTVGDVDLDARPLPLVRVTKAWKHTDGKGRELGPPKSPKSRRNITLAPAVVRAIRPLAEGRPASALLITDPRGNVVSQQTFHDIFKRAVAAAGIERGCRVHDLRHTCASWLLNSGVDTVKVQHMLGHESLKTTGDVYGHLVPDAGVVTAGALELALTAAMPEIEG